MAFVEDISEFFDDSDFAVIADFMPASGGQCRIKGIFDKEYFAVDGGEVIGVSGNQPKFMCETAKIRDAAYDDDIRILDKLYKIISIQDDGTGVTTLLLEDQE